MALAPGLALAHPHVFVEANLEIVRDAAGEITELRNVWRFDELFSSTVLLDYDDDGDGKLSNKELDEVSKTVTESIGEYDFYTKVRLDGRPRKFISPKKILVDYLDGQILMLFALKMAEPVPVVGHHVHIAISDPTYYVDMELASESAIKINGNGTACKVKIERPDFDKLYAQNSDAQTEAFFNNPNTVLGDAWLTWVALKCTQ